MLGAALVTAGGLATAGPASAVVSCAYDSTQKVATVSMSGHGDDVNVSVAGSTIVLTYAFGVPLTCSGGTPTVINTNELFIQDTGAHDQAVYLMDPTELAPGASGEAGPDEIEVSIAMGGDTGGGDSVRIVLDSDPRNLRWGAAGINVNAPELDTPDADIIATGTERFDAIGGAGGDVLGAQGGAGTGGSFAGITFEGGDGPDVLTGGDGSDGLVGQGGNDTLNGGPGNDNLIPGVGNDTLNGDAGIDVARYPEAPAAVTVDLGRAGPQDTGGDGVDALASVEDLDGSQFGDTLLGDDGVNELYGSSGDDTLVGRGGVDLLRGFQGADTLDVRDGGPDTADCGDDTDTVLPDVGGIDTLIACETVSFPVPLVPGGPGPGPGGGADVTAPLFTSAARAVPRRFRRGRRRTSLRYSLGEAGTVTYTVQRRARGRRVAGRCRRPTRANRSRPRCRRWVRVRRFSGPAVAGANARRLAVRTLRPGLHRAVLVARDAAGNASLPSRARFTVLQRRR